MQGKQIMKILVVGKQNRREILFQELAALGVDVVRSNTFEIAGRSFPDVVIDECAAVLVPAPRVSYGPAKIGRGGKIKRW